MPLTRTRILLMLGALLAARAAGERGRGAVAQEGDLGPGHGRTAARSSRSTAISASASGRTASTGPSVAPTRPAHPRDPLDPAYQWPAELDDGDRGGQALRHPDVARPDRGAPMGKRPQRSALGAEEAERLRGLRLRGLGALPVRPPLDDLERAHPGRELHAAHPREARPPADAAHEEGARTRTRASSTPPTGR